MDKNGKRGAEKEEIKKPAPRGAGFCLARNRH